MNIRKSYEHKRGCGYRKPGGLYLVSDGRGQDCGKLPIPLTVCPTCHGGIKPSRGWTWINGNELLKGRECNLDAITCGGCPCGFGERSSQEKVGLLWIGEKFYPTPGEWLHEGREMGFSRRIPTVPKDFKLGETWVWVAHRKASGRHRGFGLPPKILPGVFHIFKPTRIEYIVRKKDSKKKLKALEKRGIELVEVIPIEDSPELPQVESTCSTPQAA